MQEAGDRWGNRWRVSQNPAGDAEPLILRAKWTRCKFDRDRRGAARGKAPRLNH